MFDLPVPSGSSNRMQEATHILRTPMDAFIQTKVNFESLGKEMEAYFWVILRECAGDQRKLSDRERMNLIFFMRWAASPEGVITADELALGTSNQSIVSICGDIIGGMDWNRKCDFRDIGNAPCVKEYVERGKFSSPVTPLVLSRVLASHGDADAKQFIVNALRSESNMASLVECAGVILNDPSSGAVAKEYLEHAVQMDTVHYEMKLRVCTLLTVTNSAIARSWLIQQASATNAHTIHRMFAAKMLAQSGDMHGIDGLTSLLQNDLGHISTSSAQHLRESIPAITADIPMTKPGADNDQVRQWMSDNRNRLKWDASSRSFSRIAGEK